MKKQIISLALAATLVAGVLPVAYAANDLTHLGSYKMGDGNVDGGAAEIVAYNVATEMVYAVSGVEQKIQIVSVEDIIDDSIDYARAITLDAGDLSKMTGDFTVGDISSVAVSKDGSRVAVALQAEGDNANGRALILDAYGEFVATYEVGVQPDMVTFSPNGNYVLTADEGEPREGYDMNGNLIAAGELTSADPKGSVTIIDLENETSNTVYFDEWDAQRDELIEANVLIKKNLNPSTDFEPEYITMTDNTTAFVVLQEANAIATLDVRDGEFTDISSLGFKDHAREENALDFNKEDGEINIEPKELLGTYMPDGISSYEVRGVTYILTANEGDGSEWGDFTNEKNLELDVTYIEDGEEKNVEIDGLNPEVMDGLPTLEDGYFGHSFGARSFSIYEVRMDGSLRQVYDSGSDFELITAEAIPEFFNTTNDEDKIDDRSDNKGPEPENVTVQKIGNKYYAYIGLERIGGVMVYDVTVPARSEFIDYINTREFGNYVEDEIIDVNNSGDVSPEGICAVAPEHSPTGYPLVITGNEVSGTVAVYQHNVK